MIVPVIRKILSLFFTHSHFPSLDSYEPLQKLQIMITKNVQSKLEYSKEKQTHTLFTPVVVTAFLSHSGFRVRVYISTYIRTVVLFQLLCVVCVCDKQEKDKKKTSHETVGCFFSREKKSNYSTPLFPNRLEIQRCGRQWFAKTGTNLLCFRTSLVCFFFTSCISSSSFLFRRFFFFFFFFLFIK